MNRPRLSARVAAATILSATIAATPRRAVAEPEPPQPVPAEPEPATEPSPPPAAPSPELPRASAPDTAERPKNVTDGVYGRFDGDVDLSLAAGAAFSSGGPHAAGLMRAVFFQTAGIYASYSDALGQSDTPLARTIGLGVTLRPLFIPRWAFNLERGPAILDLTLDAIAFDFGLLWPANRDGSFGERPGLEAALGTEVPLLGKSSGPFVGARGALRWRGSELAGNADNELRPAVYITLAWHTIVDANIVDVGDARLH